MSVVMYGYSHTCNTVPKNHIHFVIFTIKNKKVHKITAGISDLDIDSIDTIERLKADHKIHFIDLRSKQEKHKF